MKIVFIGSGNVASVLGRKFRAAGHEILQVYGRNASRASALAYEWDIESTNYKSMITLNADVYIIALADDAIPEFIDDFRLTGKVVAHTAASVPKDILKTVTAHYGVFYPLQSLRKETAASPDIPIFFDGSDDKAKRVLEDLAHSISGDKVKLATDDDRKKLHVAAVIVSNFTNHLYALAQDYCKKEGLDFRQLLPLIEETALRIKNIDARQVQTGPAERKDEETIQKHIALLQSHPQLLNMYTFFTKSIKEG